MGEPELEQEDHEELQEEFSLEDHLEHGEEEAAPEEAEANYLDGIPAEDLKFAKGWNPEFKGEEAKTLKQFIADGKMMDKIDYLNRTLKKETEESGRKLERMAKLHAVQLSVQKKELEERFKDAVNMSDLDEVRNIQKEMSELDELGVEEEVVEKPADGTKFDVLPDEEKTLVQEWDIKNQWIYAANPEHPSYDPLNPDIPKSVFASSIINELANKGALPSEIISEVEKRVSEKFPEKQKAPRHLPSRTMPGKGQERGLTWDELTGSEKNMFENLPDAWDDKSEFLKAVAEDRKARGV